MNNNSFEQNFLNEYPRISEIEDMIKFCANHKNLYIYGASENCEYLGKYLHISGIDVQGYVVTKMESRHLAVYDLPIHTADEIPASKDTGILLGLGDKYQEFVISILRDKALEYFRLSEHNKHEIANCLRPQSVTKLMLEVNLADHCNLKCRSCDHYSNLILEERFLDLDEYQRDIAHLSELCAGSLEAVKLVGGEPLLHPRVIDIVKITRGHFPRSRIPLITNGLLLPKMKDEFWRALAENNVLLHVTEYQTGVDYSEIHEKAVQFGVLNNNLNIVNGLIPGTEKYMVKFPFDLSGKQEKYYFIGCHHRICSCVLRHGKIYPCPPLAYVEYFNKHFAKDLPIQDADWIDIYKISRYQEIAGFLSGRVPFCDYCDIKHRYHHSNRFKWEISSKQLEEYLWI